LENKLGTKVTLITPLRMEPGSVFNPKPFVPIGLLVVGAALEEVGCSVEIIDQTRAFQDGSVTPGDGAYDQLAKMIRATEPDLVGFGTMCNSYPQTIALARRYRALDPKRPIILGGPQASGTDVETLRAFPWVDLIVRGEAEETIKGLVMRWRGGQSLADLPGITWRENGQVYRNPDALPIEDLDAQPRPAYHLYPLEGMERVEIEAGRGCPFGCTFCSVSRYFKRRYRMKSAVRLLAEMKYLNTRYGCRYFDLSHDLFTVDKRLVQTFCQAVITSGLPLKWSCSARTDCVDEELLEEMQAAGCAGIYFGIETGSAPMQKIINKNLELGRVVPTLRAVSERGIRAICSFIVGFPEETEEDLRATLGLALELSRFETTRVQVHLLAPLVPSSLYEAHSSRLQYDGHLSDASDYLLTDEEEELVRAHPEVFASFYYIDPPHLNRDKLKAIASAWEFPNLLLGLRESLGDLNLVLDGWLAWKEQNVDDTARDYYRSQFGIDFFRYLRSEIAQRQLQETYLTDLVEYEALKFSLAKSRLDTPTELRTFRYDVKEAVRRLQAGESLSDLLPRSTHLLFTQSENEVNVIRVTPTIQKMFGLNLPT